jgi:hypothetical protein
MQEFDFLIPIDVDTNDESYIIWGQIEANAILVMALKTWNSTTGEEKMPLFLVMLIRKGSHII